MLPILVEMATSDLPAGAAASIPQYVRGLRVRTEPALWGGSDSRCNLLGQCQIAPEGLSLAVVMGQDKLYASALRRDFRSFEGMQVEADKWLHVGGLKDDPACG
jgi:hypothetical protein